MDVSSIVILNIYLQTRLFNPYTWGSLNQCELITASQIYGSSLEFV